MGEIIHFEETDNAPLNEEENPLLEETEKILLDVRTSYDDLERMSVPIAELSTLGAGVSSLIPALQTVTQTTTIPADGLYKLANAEVGDVLKVAKNGNFWGAFKTAEGKSKFAQLQAAAPISVTTQTQTIAAFNPATIMMAVALFSIEQELGEIKKMQKQILSFLEIEKEAEIEADLKTLMGIVEKFKLNWDNKYYVASNHKLVLDIQKTSIKNMIAYQKKVELLIGKKQIVVAQTNVKQRFNELEKKFKYYRLSLYIYALSSFMEIMLSGNYKEEYIAKIRNEIQKMTDEYRSLFDKSSRHLEKIGKSTVESNVLKGIGDAGKGVGKFIGSIPLIKEGPVDEFLQDSGGKMKKNAQNIQKDAVHHFAFLGSPGTGMIIDKMEDMIQIYNHTEQICFDDKRIYLLTGNKTA